MEVIMRDEPHTPLILRTRISSSLQSLSALCATTASTSTSRGVQHPSRLPPLQALQALQDPSPPRFYLKFGSAPRPHIRPLPKIWIFPSLLFDLISLPFINCHYSIHPPAISQKVIRSVSSGHLLHSSLCRRRLLPNVSLSVLT